MFYIVDKKKAEDISAAYAVVGTFRYGKVPFEAAVERETQAQIKALTAGGGASTWCPAQREALRKAGNPDIIGGNLP